MKLGKLYAIKNGEGLYWGDAQSWVGFASAAVFNEQDRRTTPLPEGGTWVELIYFVTAETN